jgi:hypothetical protein
MRPRIVFAILLAIGAALHLAFVSKAGRGVSPIVAYACWMILAVAAAAMLWFVHQHSEEAHEEPGEPGGWRARALAIEGLGWFAVTAAIGLVMHLLNLVGRSDIRSQRRGMWLLFFIFLVSCVGQLRGPAGDSDAPVPDGSRLARGAALLRRAVGVAIGCAGVGLLYLGFATSVNPGDGFGLAIAWFFRFGGAALLLIGIALTWLRGRDDA